MVSLVHSRRSLTCGYENTAFQAEKKILLNSYHFLNQSYLAKSVPSKKMIENSATYRETERIVLFL
ncbi:MAG: hypothetical protein LBK82_04175 [Planctomycetaceae bacterium]|nr:hypothetical protein [Planctomycetaceae bacterium]